MISYTLGTNIYGEPYNTSTLAGCPGYTGKYTMVFLLSVVVFYSLWIGVQLPQGKYISYGRGYIMVSIGCNIGYTPGSSVSILFPLYEFHLTPAVHALKGTPVFIGIYGYYYKTVITRIEYPGNRGTGTGEPRGYPRVLSVQCCVGLHQGYYTIPTVTLSP